MKLINDIREESGAILSHWHAQHPEKPLEDDTGDLLLNRGVASWILGELLGTRTARSFLLHWTVCGNPLTATQTVIPPWLQTKQEGTLYLELFDLVKDYSGPAADSNIKRLLQNAGPVLPPQEINLRLRLKILKKGITAIWFDAPEDLKNAARMLHGRFDETEQLALALYWVSHRLDPDGGLTIQAPPATAEGETLAEQCGQVLVALAAAQPDQAHISTQAELAQAVNKRIKKWVRLT